MIKRFSHSSLSSLRSLQGMTRSEASKAKTMPFSLDTDSQMSLTDSALLGSSRSLDTKRISHAMKEIMDKDYPSAHLDKWIKSEEGTMLLQQFSPQEKAKILEKIGANEDSNSSAMMQVMKSISTPQELKSVLFSASKGGSSILKSLESDYVKHLKEQGATGAKMIVQLGLSYPMTDRTTKDFITNNMTDKVLQKAAPTSKEKANLLHRLTQGTLETKGKESIMRVLLNSQPSEIREIYKSFGKLHAKPNDNPKSSTEYTSIGETEIRKKLDTPIGPLFERIASIFDESIHDIASAVILGGGKAVDSLLNISNSVAIPNKDGVMHTPKSLTIDQYLSHVLEGGRESEDVENFKEELKMVFGPSLDLSKIKIKSGDLGIPGSSNTTEAFVLGDTIYIPRKLDRTTFVHELVHVWQHQNSSDDNYISRALAAQFSGDGYDLTKGLFKGYSWKELNPEQQSELVKQGYYHSFFQNPDARILIQNSELDEEKSRMMDENMAVIVLQKDSDIELFEGIGYKDFTDVFNNAHAQILRGLGAP